MRAFNDVLWKAARIALPLVVKLDVEGIEVELVRSVRFEEHGHVRRGFAYQAYRSIVLIGSVRLRSSRTLAEETLRAAVQRQIRAQKERVTVARLFLQNLSEHGRRRIEVVGSEIDAGEPVGVGTLMMDDLAVHRYGLRRAADDSRRTRGVQAAAAGWPGKRPPCA